MPLSTLAITLISTGISVTLASILVYLVIKWASKKPKVTSNLFDTDSPSLQPENKTQPMSTQTLETDNRINEFKIKYDEAKSKGDTRMVYIFEAEIKRLEREKEVLLKKMK